MRDASTNSCKEPGGQTRAWNLLVWLCLVTCQQLIFNNPVFLSSKLGRHVVALNDRGWSCQDCQGSISSSSSGMVEQSTPELKPARFCIKPQLETCHDLKEQLASRRLQIHTASPIAAKSTENRRTNLRWQLWHVPPIFASSLLLNKLQVCRLPHPTATKSHWISKHTLHSFAWWQLQL